VSGDSTGLDEATLGVVLDLRHPHAYLALHPARAFADDLGIAIDWLPIEVPPLKEPSPPGPGDDRGARHRRSRAEAIARGVEIYAAAQGLTLRDCYRAPETDAFRMAWLWLRASAPERLFPFLALAFERYWVVDLDPASLDAVATLVDRVGADAAGFRAHAARAGQGEIDAMADALSRRGVGATPGYLVAGEFFEGRQHLPMIRWILGGRDGPGPI